MANQKILTDQLKASSYEKFNHISTLIVIGPMPLIENTYFPKESFGIIYVDGGILHSDKIKMMFADAPHISLGDGDSLKKNSSSHVLDFQFSPVKNRSDFAIALASVPDHCEEIYCYGFSGGDVAHELCNYGEIQYFLNNHKKPIILTLKGKNQRIIASNQEVFTFHHKGRFTLFCLEEIRFQISGDCEYNCDQDTSLFPLSSLGLSNVGFGKINIKSDKPYFIVINE